ncbi:MAG: hypothetical protein JNM56_19050 [Planctomycetia bacterium]|nr:hypothetical protein [Planctomycetia bacterium]
MPAKKSPADELAEKMTAALEAQRQSGTDYPLSLRRLGELAEPAAPSDLVLKAATSKKRPFAGRVVVSVAKNLDAPVALVDDLAALADSPRLLLVLLETHCTAAAPTCDPAKLRSKVTANLKPAFAAALDRRVQSGHLPDGVALVAVKKKQHLHLTHLPLPRPPEVVLAENLLRILEAARAPGGGQYPPTFAELIQRTQVPAPATLLKAALALPETKQRIVVFLKDAKLRDRSPVGLAEDLPRLVESPQLLELVLTLSRTATQQLFTPADLKKPLVPALHGAFAEGLQRRLASETLPSGVGSLLLKGKPLLFLLSDVRSALPTTTPLPISSVPVANSAPPPAVVSLPTQADDFAARFDAAFRDLERQARLPNFVSLVELRRAVPCDPAAFNAELHKLRLAGRYTLSAAEGRHGIRPEEQDAGIVEDGALLLFVSRKVP